MLQKGIIESLQGAYQVKVRVPKYDGMPYDSTGLKDNELATGIICAVPGTSIAYSVGDIVLVGFENDELSKPIVLGLLYRDAESDSTVVVHGISNSLEEIEKNIAKTNSTSIFVKYSDDGGATFTSLYDKNAVVSGTLKYERDEIEQEWYYQEDIPIDSDSQTVSWSILDDAGNDVTASFLIETSVYTDVSKLNVVNGGVEISNDKSIYTTTDTLFTIPPNCRNTGSMFVAYRILKTLELENYYVVLTTDKDIIGSVYGDYVGFCISQDNEAPNSVKNYEWVAVSTKSNELANRLYKSLDTRLTETETILYGHIGEEASQSGLLDGVSVRDTCVYVGANKDFVYFDLDGKVLIDVKQHKIEAPTISTGRFVLKEHYVDNTALTHFGLFLEY